MGVNPGADKALLAFPRGPVAQRRLLIVEDEPEIADVLRSKFSDEGFKIVRERDGHAGLRQVENGDFDLVVLDLVLQGFDGFDFCRRLRARSVYTPVIIVSREMDEAHRILGLELGADDCLSKPFSVLELMARIRSLFRRIDHNKIVLGSRPLQIQAGDLSIDIAARDVRVGGRPVSLTLREFDLLLFFARNPGRVFTRPELLDHVWGYGHDGYDHTVNAHINRLRSKIRPNPGSPSHITTIWGVGYKFEAEMHRSAVRENVSGTQ